MCRTTRGRDDLHQSKQFFLSLLAAARASRGGSSGCPSASPLRRYDQLSQINATMTDASIVASPECRAYSPANRKRKGSSMHPIADKAEVAIDFPDKLYMGGFGRDSAFEAKAEDDGVLIRLVRAGGEKRVAEIHLHHFLLANILEELAVSLATREPIDEVHREPLLDAARRFAAALDRVLVPSP
jgi:hypothetical protein